MDSVETGVRRMGSSVERARERVPSPTVSLNTPEVLMAARVALVVFEY